MKRIDGIGDVIMEKKICHGQHIIVNEKEKCSGCGACVNACERKCIMMQMDQEGFAYPYVNEEQCVECGLCISKCHMAHKTPDYNKDNPVCYAAYSKDIEKTKNGSSGGIFELLCETIFDMGGIVYGVSLDKGFCVRHHRAINMDEAKKFRKSKYLQSDIGNTFMLARRDLDEGKHVLFSGTPCQIAGLYGYLGKKYEKLYTVDLVCHGVPSKTVFDSYLDALENKYGKKPISICWRDKRDGWFPNKISINFDNGQELLLPSSYNSMQLGFLTNLYLRPSCYECNYASIPRISDISLGDFWGYDGVLLEKNCNRGISLVAVSNLKGEFLFDRIVSQLVVEEVNVEYCKEKSIHFSCSPKRNRMRNRFMEEFIKDKDFQKVPKQYLQDGFSAKECDLFELREFITSITQKDNNDKQWTALEQDQLEVGNTIYKQMK